MHDSDNSPRSRIGIFVIAYNAESHIEKTLGRIPEKVWNEIDVVFVIDDCSTDNTVARALRYDQRPDKFVVLRNPVNQRYGGNQKLGYQYAIERNLDVVVMLHADGQYAPECLPDLYGPIISRSADVVLGSRMMKRGDALKGGMPKYKYAGNIVLTRMEILLTGLPLTEYHSGYRAYGIDLLRRIPFWENSDEWHFDTQILLQAFHAGASIREVPIPTYYGDEICHVNGLAYAWNCIMSSLGYMLHRRGLFYQRRYDVSLRGRYYFEKFSDPYSSHSLIWARLAEEPLSSLKTLELGVGDASLTRRLHEHGATVDCVEISSALSGLAKPFTRNAYVHDLNHLDKLVLAGPYDVVIAADVLEHTLDPECILAHLKHHLKKDGLLIVSLPNIANLYVRLNLLFGRWPTHTKGLLDKTHLHQYTLKSMRKLLRRTGWTIEEETVTAIPWVLVMPFLQKKPFVWLLHLSGLLTRLFRGLLGYQGVLYCRNPNHPESIRLKP